jgi:hypothetical protein
MRRTRVCIYGGTNLQGMPQHFISAVAYQILDSMPSVIVTGGFLHSDKDPHAVSTDAAALDGARRFAADRRVDLKDCFEAWIPEPTLDGRREDKAVRRMGKAEGITVVEMTGRTALGRRLAMVAGVDAVVTISGRVHTETVIEQALELGVPVLPLPDAGGDSRDLLLKYRQKIASRFKPDALEQCLQDVSRTIDADPDTAARAVASLIGAAKLGGCLVLLPYDAAHATLYAEVIEPAVEKHMKAVRLDHTPSSKSIYTSFADAMESCSAVIADITQVNENVMYEIGYAHGRGLTPLIYTESDARRQQLPVYLRTLNVHLATQATPASRLIDDYLSAVKAGRIARR